MISYVENFRANCKLSFSSNFYGVRTSLKLTHLTLRRTHKIDSIILTLKMIKQKPTQLTGAEPGMSFSKVKCFHLFPAAS